VARVLAAGGGGTNLDVPGSDPAVPERRDREMSKASDPRPPHAAPSRKQRHEAAAAAAATRPMLPRAVVPQQVPAGAPLDHPTLYFNRELGWLDFNWRVLYQALDAALPLLERVRFLSIAYTNLDEFFQKRVGGLKRQQAAGVQRLSRDGRAPSAQLEMIRSAVLVMNHTLSQVWERELRPALREQADMVVADYTALGEHERRTLDTHFREHIYPVLTPLAVDPGHPFPFISDLSLSLALLLRHPVRGSVHFARVKVPTSQGRWVQVPNGTHAVHVVAIEDLIRHNVGALFRGMEVLAAHAFRVTRNADVRRAVEEADDLLAMISEEVRERRFAPVVRLEVEDRMPAQLRELLLRELELVPQDLYDVAGLLDPGDCAELAALGPREHAFEPWEPVVPAALQHEGETDEAHDIFAILRAGSLLVHHPYESFAASAQRLVEEAAADPAVVAIKQTLYRTSEDSPVVSALIRAAERGKQVAVLVEVSARFDEANNIEWAERLEDAGVHVTYGLVGLKTHAKALLVIRTEAGRPHAYCHIGTGNYHAKTARLYTDVGLLTCEPEVTADVVNLFHYLTGYAPDQQYRRLIVAPRDMRLAFVERIRREVRAQRRNGNGRIIAKVNALDDAALMEELYRASQAGVRIDLIVRGHCSLRPGLPGYSETIQVRSIIGRFLEHDRVYYFANGGDDDNGEVLLGSADWRARNLSDRVEAIVPVTEPALKKRLVRTLEYALKDNALSWELTADGHYLRRHPRADEELFNVHERLMRSALERARTAGAPWDLTT
jgi:polyphosphate kinase